jgi:hypothetical protein
VWRRYGGVGIHRPRWPRCCKLGAAVKLYVGGWISLVVWGALVGGCSGRQVDDPGDGELEDAGGDAGDGDAMGDDLARLAEAMCAREAACGCSPDDVLAECRAVHLQGLTGVGDLAAEEADYSFDPACLRELADCWEQIPCGMSYEEAVASCDSACVVHRVSRDVGSQCESEPWGFGPAGFVGQCEAGLECLGGHGYAVCDVDSPLEVGDNCFDPGFHRHCGAGLYCTTEDGDGVCAPRMVEGGICETWTACASELRCVDSVCVPRAAAGAACETDFDCLADLSCHPVESACVAPAEIGQPCRFPVGPNIRFVPCADGAWCGDPNCEAMLELGDACMFSDGCPDGSGCEGGVCTDCRGVGCNEPICALVPDPVSYPSED